MDNVVPPGTIPHSEERYLDTNLQLHLPAGVDTWGCVPHAGGSWQKGASYGGPWEQRQSVSSLVPVLHPQLAEPIEQT